MTRSHVLLDHILLVLIALVWPIAECGGVTRVRSNMDPASAATQPCAIAEELIR
jgi:hypothetical protein